MRKQNGRISTFRFLKITLVLILASAAAGLPAAPPIMAGEAHPEPARQQAETVSRENHVILQRINENIFIIGGRQYLCTHQTRIFHKGELSPDRHLKPETLQPPYLVNIISKYYKVATEGAPFIPGKPVLEKIILLKKLDAATPPAESTPPRSRR